MGRAIQAVITAITQPVARFRVELDMHVLVGQLQFELEDELVHHAAHHFLAQIGEGHDGIQTVAEFRREQVLHRLLARIRLAVSPKPMPLRAMSLRPHWWS
jgi:hypothetical protein